MGEGEWRELSEIERRPRCRLKEDERRSVKKQVRMGKGDSVHDIVTFLIGIGVHICVVHVVVDTLWRDTHIAMEDALAGIAA